MQHLEADGVVFLHGGGAIVRGCLEAGEQIRANPGCLLAYVPDNLSAEMWGVERAQGFENMFLGQGMFVGTLMGPGWSGYSQCLGARSRRILLQRPATTLAIHPALLVVIATAATATTSATPATENYARHLGGQLKARRNKVPYSTLSYLTVPLFILR